MIGQGKLTRALIGQDSNPGPEPEDHMEKSWLVDKGGMVSRLPKQCHAIGNYTEHASRGERFKMLFIAGTTSRGIVGVNHGAAVELENICEEVESSLITVNLLSAVAV